MAKRRGPDLPKSPLVSCNYYAKSKGIDTKTMRRALKAVGLRGRIDPVEADKRLADAKSARTQSEGAGKEDSYAEADRRHKWAKAAQEELKLQKIQGTLVLRTAVKAQTFDMVRRSRDKLQNIPARLSGVLAAESDQARVFEILTREIHQALEDLAS